MRKFLSISLIIILAFQCMGFVWLQQLRLEIWHHAQWEKLEKSMKAGQDLEGVETLTFAHKDAVAWENAHEFSYQGELYDVLSMRPLADGGLELRCVADRVEERMCADFKAMLLAHEAEQGALTDGEIDGLETVDYLEEPLIILGLTDGSKTAFFVFDWMMRKAPARPPDVRPPTAA